MRTLAFDKLLIAACFALLAFYPQVAESSWRSSSDVHALLEFSSSLLAVTAGVMVLSHFLTTGRVLYLFIAVGFVQLGAEEFVHAIFSFERLWPIVIPSVNLGITSTWLAGRITFMAALYLAYFCGKTVVAPERRLSDAVVFNVVGFALSATIALLIFKQQSLLGAWRLGTAFKQLLELGIAGLYFVVFLLYYRMYARARARSPLMLSLLACMAFQVVLHLFFFDAQQFFDAHWDAAHVLKLLGYFFPVFGVWGETMLVHRRAQRSFDALQIEVAERRRSEAELADYREHLEEMVAQRTAELERTLDNLRRTQEQLLQAEKLSALGSMVAGVSHELNTPLGNAQMAITTLIGRLGEVQASYLDNHLTKQQIGQLFDEGAKLSAIAQRSVERALALVTSFKQVAVDQTSQQRRAFDLATVVGETVAALRPSYKNQPWEFHIDVPTGLAMDSYPGPLEQCIVNLVQNSIRHGFDGRERGCVHIQARQEAVPEQESPQIALTLSDDGVGIAPENLGRIFDPFFTTTLGRGGSGIGLNITHRIATTLLGGTISAHSQDRSGTTFVLRIPQRAPVLI